MKKAIFLDRDGVINKEKNYLYLPQDFEFFDGIFEALRVVQSLGYIFVVVTNQSGIARGYYTLEDFDKLTKWMVEKFKEHGINIAKVNFCPHGPNDNCECRKPNPLMITQAAKALNIDLSKSWMIGDKNIDIECAINANIPQSQTIQSRSGHSFDETISKANFIIDSIADIDKIIRC